MTVTVTGIVIDATGRRDARSWRVFSPTYREGSNGETVNERWQTVRATGGVFTAELDPGVCVIQDPDGGKYVVTIPDTPADLWTLIEQAVAVPPTTGADLLAAAVASFVEDNDGYPWSGIADKPDILLALASNPEQLATGTITRSESGAATSFSVTWPDGGTGTFTGTESTTFPGAINSYTVTHILNAVTTTYTQPTLTRDSTGAVTNKPPIVVS